MTTAEKIEMYKGKKAFVDKISDAFIEPRVSSVENIDYEVYCKEVNDNTTYFVEYVVVTFKGGAISAAHVSGNSCTAIFRSIGTMIDGGYYDEVRDWETLPDRGFEYVALN